MNHTAATDPNAAVNELADRFWDGVLERDPVYATILGDDRWDDRLPDLGGRQGAPTRRALPRDAGGRGGDRPGGLDPEQVITRDMLILVASTHLEALEQKQYQLAINHIFGTQTMPVRIAQYQIADTPEGLERLLTRFGAYPAAIEQEIETLREGIADGRTGAAIPVRKQIEQIERMLAAPPPSPSRRWRWRTSPMTPPASGSAPRSRRTSIRRSSACATSWPMSTRRRRALSRASPPRPAARRRIGSGSA